MKKNKHTTKVIITSNSRKGNERKAGILIFSTSRLQGFSIAEIGMWHDKVKNLVDKAQANNSTEILIVDQDVHVQHIKL